MPVVFESFLDFTFFLQRIPIYLKRRITILKKKLKTVKTLFLVKSLLDKQLLLTIFIV